MPHPHHKLLSGNQGCFFLSRKHVSQLSGNLKTFPRSPIPLVKVFEPLNLTTGLIVNKEWEKDKGSRLVSGLGESKDRMWFAFWRRNITKPLFEIQSQNTWLFLNPERLANAASWVTSSSRPRKPFSSIHGLEGGFLRSKTIF